MLNPVMYHHHGESFSTLWRITMMVSIIAMVSPIQPCDISSLWWVMLNPMTYHCHGEFRSTLWCIIAMVSHAETASPACVSQTPKKERIPALVSPSQLQKHHIQEGLCQFSSRWYRWAWKSPYALHPTSCLLQLLTTFAVTKFPNMMSQADITCSSHTHTHTHTHTHCTHTWSLLVCRQRRTSATGYGCFSWCWCRGQWQYMPSSIPATPWAWSRSAWPSQEPFSAFFSPRLMTLMVSSIQHISLFVFYAELTSIVISGRPWWWVVFGTLACLFFTLSQPVWICQRIFDGE